MSSGKSVPKLKTDFTLLYKGMMGSYGKKSPTHAKTPSPILGSSAGRIPSAPKKPTSQTPTQPYISPKGAPDASKSINSLFRSSTHLDTHNGEDGLAKPYTPAEISGLASKGGVRASHAHQWTTGFEKREPVQTNIIFNPRALNKGMIRFGVCPHRLQALSWRILNLEANFRFCLERKFSRLSQSEPTQPSHS